MTSLLFVNRGIVVNHGVVGIILKNADSASKLKTARNIAITGAVSGSGNFDGSGNLSISTILNNFGSLKAENGYKYLGDGLILQWGTMNYTSYPGETKVDITFPITFPNNVLNINSTRKMAQHSASGRWRFINKSI